MGTFRQLTQIVVVLALLSVAIIATARTAEAQGIAPIIRFHAVWAENRPGFVNPHLSFTAFVDDPDGQVPLTITSVVVTGPGGPFNLPFFYPNGEFRGQYFLDTGLSPVSGVYTFTVTDNQGLTHVLTDTLGTVPALSPPNVTLPTSEQILTTTTPTFLWNAVPGAGSLRVSIQNLDQFATFGDTLYRSQDLPGTATQFSLASGLLTPGRRSLLRVEAFDLPGGFGPHNIRATTQVPFSVRGPSVELFLNQRTFTTGQTLRLGVRFRNPGVTQLVEVQLGVGLPGGAPPAPIFELDFLLPATPPDVSTVVPDILVHTFTGAEPPGNYAFGITFFPVAFTVVDLPEALGTVAFSFTP